MSCQIACGCRCHLVGDFVSSQGAGAGGGQLERLDGEGEILVARIVHQETGGEKKKKTRSDDKPMKNIGPKTEHCGIPKNTLSFPFVFILKGNDTLNLFA